MKVLLNLIKPSKRVKLSHIREVAREISTLRDRENLSVLVTSSITHEHFLVL